MTTATKSKPKTTPLAGVEALEAKCADAGGHEREVGRQLKEKHDALRELLDQRGRLTHREPGLVDHNGVPTAGIADNPIAAIDEQIQALGDLNDLTAQVNHARELQRVARERFEAAVVEHGDAIDDSRLAEGEALLSSYQSSADAHAAVAEQLVAFGQRSMQFAHIRRIDTRRIPIDQAADAARTARAMAASPPPLPLQELDR